MSLIDCSNNENDDLLLLAKYQYGPINNVTMVPAMRFVMAQHLALNPYSTRLLTLGVIANKLTRVVMAFYGEELLKHHCGSFLPNLLEKFAKDAHAGLHELFHQLTILQMRDTEKGVDLRPIPRPDEKMCEALEAYLKRLEWLGCLREGAEVIWTNPDRSGESTRCRIVRIPKDYYRGVNDADIKFEVSDIGEVPVGELWPVDVVQFAEQEVSNS